MTGFIPQEIIEEILRKSDIVEIISSYLPISRRGKIYFGLCPFHSEDTPSFSVTPDKQIFYCYGCQKGGNAISFIMEMEQLSYPEAVRRLAERVGVDIAEDAISPEERAKALKRQQLLRIHQLAEDFYAEQLKTINGAPARAYLQKRGIAAEIAERFNLGYAPESDWEAAACYLQKEGFSRDDLELAGLVSFSPKTGKLYDKFHGRLIFPIKDSRGQVIAFGGRILGQGEPKYLNSTQTPIYNKSQQLFGLSAAAAGIRAKDFVMLVEGYLDVVICHQYGLDNTVAPLGTAFTEEQSQLIARYNKNVLLCFDGDGAGQKATLRSIDILRKHNFNIKILALPDGSDPDDYLRQNGKDGWDKYLQQKQLGVLPYLLYRAKQSFDFSTPEGKAQIVSELSGPIIKTRSTVEQESFIRQMSRELEVPAETIYTELRKSGLSLEPPLPKYSACSQISDSEMLLNTEKQILRLMLESPEFFAVAEPLLTQTPFINDNCNGVLAYLRKNLQEYNFYPTAILDDIEQENKGLRQFLLNLLQVNLPYFDEKAGKARLLGEYIKARQISDLQVQLEQLKNSLNEKPSLMRETLTQINIIHKQIQQLKAKEAAE